MKKLFIYTISLFISTGLMAQTGARLTLNFNDNWKFSLKNDSTAIQPAYNDAAWRSLNLPHDWSIEGGFSKDHPATTQGGALPTGIGWYRKTFVLPKQASGKQVRIEFDGVYRNSEVWVNGQHLGLRPYGYSAFSYDLTPYIKPAPQKNVITVKVDNSMQPNSRWYSGSGIYRNVKLVATNTVAIKKWGQFITTPQVNKQYAVVNFATGITNLTGKDVVVAVNTKVFDGAGKPVNTEPISKIKNITTGKEGATHEYAVYIKQPALWSVDKPNLYKAVTTLTLNGKVVDELSQTFGIRHFHFDKDKGFFLNGDWLKIKGVCNHHDLGAMGAAVNVRAMERQLEILKAMGCNAIRTAHNPPAQELLELCDRMGFLVMDEAFDMWAKKKNKFDYFADFKQWHREDLLDMVLRDRNHPSVFMWSIGNEIREQFDSTGITLTKEMVALIKSVDTTRPVTAGLSEWNPEKNFMYKAGALDVIGLNYHHEVYEDFQQHFPDQVFIGSENMSAFATRGHYDMPSDSTYFWPAASPQKIVEKGNPDYTVSAYDQVSAYWGSTHETTWKLIKKHDFLSGLFVWSGFDFIGEPIPYPWPARSSYYGIIDLAGFPKDVYYMYQSEWTNKPMLHIFPHWNWKPGQLVDIWAYYNQADEVELWLNGRSLGVKKKEGDALHVQWRVPFEAGTIKAVSRKNGKTIVEKVIHTAGAAARIELVADRTAIHADGKDLSFVTARIVDKDGNLVPDADNTLTWKVGGAAFLAATDNGYQADTVSFKSAVRKCWKGLALGIVQNNAKKGNITVLVSSPGLPPASITLRTKP